MKRTFKNLLFVFAMILLLPCVAIFTGCKPKETGFYVVYKGIRINGGTLNLSFDSTEEIDVLSEIQAYATIKKKADQKLEYSSLEISSNISETVEPGDEYEVEIKYKKFKPIKINIKINKLENSVSIGKNSKVYDGETFENQDLNVSATIQTGMTIEWYCGEKKLSSNPTDAGNYRVKISISESKKYKKVEKYFDVEILKAEPTVDWGVISISNTYLSTDTLSKITLPENFSWKEPQTVLSVGTNKYTVVYTPTDSNYKAVEREFDVSALLAFNLPTQKTITFNRETITLSAENLVGFDADLMELKEGANELSQLNAGEYSAKIGFKDGVDACWADGTKEDKDFSWKISKRVVKIPYYKTDFILMPLTGSFVAEWEFDEKYCYITNSGAVQSGNKTTITFDEPSNVMIYYKLNDPDNCVWEDGTSEDATQWMHIERDVFEQIKYTPYGGEERIISTAELMSLEKVCVGSAFEFVLKESSLVLKINYNVVENEKVFATADLNRVEISVYETESDTNAIFSKYISIYLYATSVVVNGEEKNVDLIDNNYYVYLEENQTTVSIELPKVLEGRKYNLYYVDLDDNFKSQKISGLHFVVNNVDKMKYFEIIDSEFNETLLNVEIYAFSRIDHFVFNTISEYGEDQEERSYYPGEGVSVSKLIDGLDVVFKEGYENLTFELSDANGNVFTSFESLNGKEYFFVQIKNGNNVVESVKVYYQFINSLGYYLDANSNAEEMIDYYSYYVFIKSQDEFESKTETYNSKLEIVLNNGEDVTFSEFGFYKFPISVTYAVTENFTVSYSTKIIVNYSNDYDQIVKSGSYLNIKTIYRESPFKLSVNSNNKMTCDDISEIRAILEGNVTVDTTNLKLETGYTFKSVTAFITGDTMFGFKFVFEKDGQDVECLIYVPVEGIYNGDTGIKKVMIESYVYDYVDCSVQGTTIIAENLNQLKFVSIYPNNEQSLCKIVDGLGNVVFAGMVRYMNCFDIVFKEVGTYVVTIIAPNGERKEYTLVVSGKDISKPITRVEAGSGKNKVTLECNKVDEDSYGDFIIDYEKNDPIFVGYFGENMLSQIKTKNGEEFLDVSIESILIDKMSIDKNGKVAVKNGVNTLKVLSNENEEKYVEIYISITMMEREMVVKGIVYLADLPTDGE